MTALGVLHGLLAEDVFIANASSVRLKATSVVAPWEASRRLSSQLAS